MFLVFIGLVMVFSASAVMAKERFGSALHIRCSRQLCWAVAGMLAMVVAMKIDYRRYKHPAVCFHLLGVTTLMLISRVFSRSRPQHPSLDSLSGILFPTLGTGQAGNDSVSRVFSREPHQSI